MMMFGFGQLGIGPMELVLILSCCGTPLLIGGVVAVVILVARSRNSGGTSDGPVQEVGDGDDAPDTADDEPVAEGE